jgi:hypothetical protein
MSTGEGGAVSGDARDDHDERERRGGGERIGIGGGDESVVRIQLAARWAEAYGRGTDSLGNILKRFRAGYEYLDAVTHGVEPPDLDRELMETRAVVPPASGPTVTPPPGPPPAYTPPPAPPPPPAQPGAQPPPRPWG